MNKTTPVPITAGTEAREYCFKPLLSEDNNKLVLLWGHTNEDNKSTLRMKQLDSIANSNTEQGIEIYTLKQGEDLMYFEQVESGIYKYVIETPTGCNIVYINNLGEELKSSTVSTDSIPVPISKSPYYQSLLPDCCEFWYNYNQETLTMNDLCFKKVFSIPLVIKTKRGYVYAWLSRDDYLHVNYYDGKTVSELVSCYFPVEYLIGSQIDADLIVIGGYSCEDDTLKLNYYRVPIEMDPKTSIEKIDAQYWRSNDYHGKYFTIAPLRKGFMLLAEGPESPIMIQRFTHLGTWLYPLRRPIKGCGHSWSPVMSGDMLYFEQVKDCQIWACQLNIDEIPEISNMSL